jgi:hypothetical protein
MDRHEESNSRSSQFLRTRLKMMSLLAPKTTKISRKFLPLYLLPSFYFFLFPSFSFTLFFYYFVFSLGFISHYTASSHSTVLYNLIGERFDGPGYQVYWDFRGFPQSFQANTDIVHQINPLTAEINPICHLLALLPAHPILHVSRIRVKPWPFHSTSVPIRRLQQSNNSTLYTSCH